MPALKNQRHEQFCQGLISGKPYTRAYTAAGYAKDDSHAARLARNGQIVARVNELREAMAGKLFITMEQIALQLLEDRALAYELGQSSAAIAANNALAKLFGHITDRSESTQTINHNYSQMTEDEVLFELAGLNQELRALKASKGKVSH